MSYQHAAPPLPRPIIRWVQAMMRRHFWGQNIHPSARIAATAHIDRTWPKGIWIEAGAVIDEHAIVLAHDMTRVVYRDTRIGAGSHIGPRAIILPGVTIGKAARIAPGAVVTKDVADGATVRGNPGRPVEAAAD